MTAQLRRGERARLRSLVRVDVRLHLAPTEPGVIVELPSRRLEGILNREVRIFEPLDVIVRAADDELQARHADDEADAVMVALLVVSMGRFDEDAAADDPIEERLELFGRAPDLRLQRRAGRQLVECDLEWMVHTQS
jgi:hypothetical protein